MITLMLICVLIGILAQLSGVIALVGSVLWIFFVLYLCESICLCIMGGKMQLPNFGMAFVPILRGKLEDAALEKLGQKKSWTCFLCRLVYFVGIIFLYYVCFDRLAHYMGQYGKATAFPVAAVNTLSYMTDQLFTVSVVSVVLVIILIAYLVMTYRRAIFFKDTKVPVVIGFIISICFTNVFGIVGTIIYSQITKKKTE